MQRRNETFLLVLVPRGGMLGGLDEARSPAELRRKVRRRKVLMREVTHTRTGTGTRTHERT